MLVSHQENPESASTKLEALGTISIELTTLVLGISIILFIVQKYTIQSFRGAHQCASMDRTFRWKRICKKSPRWNRSESLGSGRNGLWFYRSR